MKNTIFLLLLLVPLIVKSKIYVDKDAVGANNGTSWTNAYTNLQVALDTANSGDEIRVKQGIYHPTEVPESANGSTTPAEDRFRSFHYNKDLILKGGFNAEGVQELKTPTILSGDLKNDDVVNGSGNTLTFNNIDDNTSHVLIAMNLTSSSLIQNFTIKGGHWSGDSYSLDYQGHIFRLYNGGGINLFNSLLTFRDIRIEENYSHYGGGIILESSSPSFFNVTFSKNMASFPGGGMYNATESKPILENCSFVGNYANNAGGAMFNSASHPIITNTLFEANHSNETGGAMHNTGPSSAPSNPTITNCTFQFNTATKGGAISNYSSSPIINKVSFVDNEATSLGGAIFNGGNTESPSSNPKITNVIFVKNKAISGGAIYNFAKAKPIIINANFINNSGAIYNLEEATPTVTNCVFFNNSTDIENSDNISMLDKSSSNNASDAMLGTKTGWIDLQTYNAEDLFKDITNIKGADNTLGTIDDGLMPTAESPLINRGKNTGLNTSEVDLAGQTREIEIIDIGAYEYGVILTTENLTSENSIFMYPNPIHTNNTLYFNTELPLKQISIYDTSGKIIHKQNTSNCININIKKGIYLVKIETEKGIQIKKLLVL